ncbi:hypothetical protein CROQUDRAFT_659235 [Cronartium quercuum f. sp. fusiforme G11]|uniref:Uncharacterized protein n=1 Tax=Cronartium quercuum f. sp. fusiforme G11 TaxID=708437 RepID=A0A9P6TAB8_9BASI|nr:hypothetical protein CROQUDRAFT_659235 [Cronartium quercuum f. sp. fusiforme G11]
MNTLPHPTQLDSTQPSKTIEMPSKKTSNSDEQPSGKDHITWTPEKDCQTDLSQLMGLIQLSHLNLLNWTCSRLGGWFDERWDCREILLKVVVDVQRD